LYQTGLSIRKHGISAEFALPLNYRRLVDLIECACLQLEDCKDKHEIYQTSHIPVRFVQQSKAYLSPCYTGPKMFVDFPTLEDVKGSHLILARNQEHVVEEEQGVPHWGKVNEYIYNKDAFIRRHYPMAKKWCEIREKMDPRGTFLSDFVLNMGLGELPTAAQQSKERLAKVKL
jgi:hypothetical protein